MNVAPSSFAPAGNQSGVRAPIHLIEAEKLRPMNCFTIGKTIESCIELTLGHPLGNGRPALVLDEDSYIKRADQGCLYEVVPGKSKALVRRAQIVEIDIPGGKPVKTLGRHANEPPTYALVHVCHGLQEGILRGFINPVWSGVVGGKMIAWGKEESLVQLKKGESLSIFYPDGSVASVHYDGLINLIGKKPQKLMPGDALSERLGYFNEHFVKAKTQTDPERKAKQRDWCFHQLADMLRLTKLYPDLREEITGAVGHNVKNVANGELSEGVRKHFIASLRFIGDTRSYWWLDGSSSNNESSKAPARKTGKPASEKTRKTARRQRDVENHREKCKDNPPRNDDSNNHRGKKKAKK